MKSTLNVDGEGNVEASPSLSDSVVSLDSNGSKGTKRKYQYPCSSSTTTASTQTVKRRKMEHEEYIEESLEESTPRLYFQFDLYGND